MDLVDLLVVLHDTIGTYCVAEVEVHGRSPADARAIETACLEDVGLVPVVEGLWDY